jgi:hypothetical protein
MTMRNKQPLSPQFKAAREVVRREMHSYDLLSQPSKLRYERAVVRAIDDGALSPEYTCGHGVMLYEPCEKCTRTVEECQVYLRAAQARVKELLARLGGKS